MYFGWQCIRAATRPPGRPSEMLMTARTILIAGAGLVLALLLVGPDDGRLPDSGAGPESPRAPIPEAREGAGRAPGVAERTEAGAAQVRDARGAAGDDRDTACGLEILAEALDGGPLSDLAAHVLAAECLPSDRIGPAAASPLRVRADPAGRMVLDGLAPDSELSVTVTAHGCFPVHEIVRPVPSGRMCLRVLVRRRPLLAGRLRGADGRPRAGAPIRVAVLREYGPGEPVPWCPLPEDPATGGGTVVDGGHGTTTLFRSVTVTTDEDGRFELRAPATGKASLAFVGEGEVAMTEQPIDGHEAIIEVELAARPASERLRILRADGNPLAGARVRIVEDRVLFGVLPDLETDRDGGLPAAVLRRGSRYTAFLSATGDRGVPPHVTFDYEGQSVVLAVP